MKTADCCFITSSLPHLLINGYKPLHYTQVRSDVGPASLKLHEHLSHAFQILTQHWFSSQKWSPGPFLTSHIPTLCENSRLDGPALKMPTCKLSRPAAFKRGAVLFDVLFLQLLAQEAFHHHYIRWKRHSTLSQIRAGNIYQTLLLFQFLSYPNIFGYAESISNWTPLKYCSSN